MDQLTLWMALGFLFAGYSVIANDSVQTLGTFIASNSEKFKRYYLAAAASIIHKPTTTTRCKLCYSGLYSISRRGWPAEGQLQTAPILYLPTLAFNLLLVHLLRFQEYTYL